jgi:hypothetical protein
VTLIANGSKFSGNSFQASDFYFLLVHGCCLFLNFLNISSNFVYYIAGLFVLSSLSRF